MIITILNYESGEVMFIRLTDEMSNDINEKYDGDVESWILGNGIEKKFDFRLSDCHYMTTEEMPEIYGYDTETMQEQQLFLFS